MWYPRLKSGYWLDSSSDSATLVTTPERPVVEHDLEALPGAVWPVQVTVGGSVPSGPVILTCKELQDSALRRKWLAGEPVSFPKRLNGSHSVLNADGKGELTVCGNSGQLVVGVGIQNSLHGLLAEVLIDPDFDATQVAQVSPQKADGNTTLTDKLGRTAVIGKAHVALQDGRPLLTFALPLPPAELALSLTGLVVDAAGQPVAGVRVGAAQGSAAGSAATSRQVLTDAEGAFRLEVALQDRRPDTYVELVLNKTGYAATVSPQFRVGKKGDQRSFDAGQIKLHPGRSLSVRTVDANDRPLPGAVVEPQGNYALRRLATRTDAQGRAVLRDLPPGQLRLQASYGSRFGYEMIRIDNRSSEETTATLVIK